MSETQSPFYSISFNLLEDRRPRCAFRMLDNGDGTYELHVEKGSAANPLAQFTRTVPASVAARLKDGFQDAGVFSWEESYGDLPTGPALRWSLSVVFKKDVFSVTSKGGNDVPAGFDLMLEELYRLDFPRPDEPAKNAGVPIPAAGGAGVDFSQLAHLMGEGGMQGLDPSEMVDLLSEAGSNPQAFQQRMRDEFRHLPADDQERMLDALASAGFASRAWWERFLRGY